MKIEITPHDDTEGLIVDGALRVETTIETDDGQQYKVFFLDADDSFDVVVHYPNSEREIVWSVVRERKGAV